MQKQLDFDFITRGDDHPYIIIVYADYAKYLTPTCHTPSHTEKMLTSGLLRMYKMNIENRWFGWISARRKWSREMFHKYRKSWHFIPKIRSATLSDK